VKEADCTTNFLQHVDTVQSIQVQWRRRAWWKTELQTLSSMTC